MSIGQTSMPFTATQVTEIQPTQLITATNAQQALSATTPLILTDAISAVVSGGHLVNDTVYYGGEWRAGYSSDGKWIEPTYVGGVSCSKGKSGTCYCPVGGSATIPYTTITFNLAAATAPATTSYEATQVTDATTPWPVYWNAAPTGSVPTGSASSGFKFTPMRFAYLAGMLLIAFLA